MATNRRKPTRRSKPPPSKPPRSKPARSEPARSKPPRSKPPRSEPPLSKPARSKPAPPPTPSTPSPRPSRPSRAPASADTRKPSADIVVRPLRGLPSSLKEAVQLILERERTGAIMSHQLGTLYAHVMNEELYEEVGYDTFWDWVEEKMGRTRKYVQKLMAIVNVFPDEREVTEIGVKKAGIIASVSDERVRKQLVNAAKRGAPTRTIHEKIKLIRERERELKGAPRPGRPPRYVEIEKLLAFRRKLKPEQPVQLAPGVTVELRRIGGGVFRLKFARSE